MKHRLLVDSISLLSSFTGIGRYTYEISKQLEQRQNIDMAYFYGYYSKKLLKPSLGTEIKSLKSILVKSPIIKKMVRKILFTTSRIFAPSYDLYWQPNFIPNAGIKAKKTVTSVHDFSFIFYRDFHPKERIEYFDTYFYKNIMQSDMIITGSEYSKQEILQRLDVADDRVKVIYHGIDHNLFKVDAELETDLDLPEKFIFSVGSIEPRKNLIGLLVAYNSLSDTIKNEYHLVLAGFRGWENREIMDLINQNKEYIHYLGYVSDRELACIYNLASLFVYPSLYEGFGLPPLEAMACGTPVVTSNVSSLPEVGGDAVVYCDPYDIEDIRDKMEMVLEDEALQKVLIKKGLERAKLFSWKKSAQEHMKVFEELLKK